MPLDFDEVLDEMDNNEEDEDEDNELLRLLAKGRVFLDTGEFDEAIKIYKSLYAFGKALFEEDKDDYEIYVLGLMRLAEVQRKSENYKDALQTYDELLRMSKEIKDMELEGDVHSMISETYEEYGEFISESITHLKQQYEIFKSNSFKSPGDLAKLGYNLAERYRLLGETTKALDMANEALSYGQTAGPEVGDVVAFIHTSMGRVYLRCGEVKKAEESFKTSFSVASNDERARPAIMDSYLGLAQLAAQRNQTEKLEELTEKAEHEASNAPKTEERKNVKSLCRIYTELADLKCATGNYKKVDGLIQKSLALARKSGYPIDQCQCLSKSVLAYISFGELSKALSSCYEIQEITRSPRNRHLEYMTFRMLVHVQKELGNLDEALKNCQTWWQCLENYHSENRTMKAELTFELSTLYLAKAVLGRDPKKLNTENLSRAIRYMENSAEIMEQLGKTDQLCETLNALASAYLERGELDKALSYAEKARGLVQSFQNKLAKSDILQTLGNIKLALKQIDEAEKNFNEAFQLSLQSEDQAAIARSYDRLGFTAIKKEDFESAIAHFNHATAITDKLRRAIDQQGQKISFMEINTKSYHRLELVYLHCGRYNDAIVTSERRRARAFIEMIHARYWSQQNLPVLQSHTEPSFEKLKKIVDAEKAVFVVFSHHNEPRGGIFVVWLMAPEKGVVATTMVEFEDFPTLVHDLRKMMCPNDMVPVRKSRNIEESNILDEDGVRNKDNSGPPELEQVLQQFYQKLFGDVHARLEDEMAQTGCKNLVVLPSRALFLTPFAALITSDGKMMYEKYNLRITAAIQALELKQNENGSSKKSDTLNVLSVGNPNVPTVRLYGNLLTPCDLDGAEVEAAKVGKLFGAEPLINKEATKEAVLDRLPSADIVHFACHGSWKYKALLLAPSMEKPQNDYTEDDVLLTAGEVLKLDLKAKLVVLSACNSGTGELNSEGMVGLTRSFLAAGASAVIAALWLLPDDATQLFMEYFYQSWKSGKLASESLREAAEAIQTKSVYRHPHFWASFVLMGHDVKLK